MHSSTRIISHFSTHSTISHLQLPLTVNICTHNFSHQQNTQVIHHIQHRVSYPLGRKPLSIIPFCLTVSFLYILFSGRKITPKRKFLTKESTCTQVTKQTPTRTILFFLFALIYLTTRLDRAKFALRRVATFDTARLRKTEIALRRVATFDTWLVLEMLSRTVSTIDDVRADDLVCGAGTGGESGPLTAVSWQSWKLLLLAWAVVGFGHCFGWLMLLVMLL